MHEKLTAIDFYIPMSSSDANELLKGVHFKACYKIIYYVSKFALQFEYEIRNKWKTKIAHT